MVKQNRCPLLIVKNKVPICKITGKVCEWSNTWPYYLECPYYMSRQKRLWEVVDIEPPPNYEDLIISE